MAVKLKINKKDPPNKREPIVVSDIKDPRLKSYQDSLRAYNKNENWKRFLQTAPDYKYNIEDIEKLAEKYRFPAEKAGAFDLGVKNKLGETIGTRRRILAREGGGGSMSYWFPDVKKPVQPIIYKKPEIKKEEKPEPKKEEQKPVKGIVFSKKPELLVDKSGNYTWFQENREGDLIPIRRATSEEIKSVKQ
jgi:hypothetical protein